MAVDVQFVTSLNVLEEFERELRKLTRSPWKRTGKGIWTHAQYRGRVVFSRTEPIVTVKGDAEIDLSTKFVAWAMDHFGTKISSYLIQ